MRISQFTFNPFSENTFILSDETGECIIIDPGMVDRMEDEMLFDFIADEKLNPVRVVNTHCHIDHILGVSSACDTYKIEFWMHQLDLPILQRANDTAMMYGIPFRGVPEPHKFIDEGDKIIFGNTSLDILFVPGHAPGHIAFVNHTEKLIIGGDVLFKGSVGRVDFPGCSASDLTNSIQNKLYTLADEYVVYPGHGPETTIGEEKKNNVFVREDWSGL